MSIEKDIKQVKPFKSTYEKLLVNILFTENWIRRNQLLIFKKHDLSNEQYNVLRILRGHSPKPISINGIIDRMLDKMSNASRLVDKLVQKEYAERLENPEDRRICDVFITEKGLEILTIVDKEIFEFESSFKTLSTEEANLLSDLLDKLRDSNES